MRQKELHLTHEDRSVIDEIRSKGVHQSREVNSPVPTRGRGRADQRA